MTGNCFYDTRYKDDIGCNYCRAIVPCDWLLAVSSQFHQRLSGVRIIKFPSASVRDKPFNGHIKPQSNRQLYSNTVIGTLAVDEWAVTFGTARRKLWGLRARPVPSSPYQM